MHAAPSPGILRAPFAAIWVCLVLKQMRPRGNGQSGIRDKLADFFVAPSHSSGAALPAHKPCLATTKAVEATPGRSRAAYAQN